MKRLLKYQLLLVMCLTAFGYKAQDTQLTQYFNSPLYMNPALTGMVKGSRYVMNYRNQWNGIEKGYTSMGFSADINAQDIKSGLGYSLLRDVAGVSKLSNTKHSIYYSHKLQLNKRHWVNAGLRFSHNVREIDFNALLFSDQVINDNAPVTTELNLMEKTNYQEIGLGFAYYTYKLWLGVSYSHINGASNSLLEGGQSDVPTKFSLHGGVMLWERGYRRKKEDLKFLCQYKSQQDWRQLDLGLFYKMNGYSVGGIYRGHPFNKDESLSSRDAFAIAVKGEFYDSWVVGYSYDITISNLSGQSGGAHEISVTYTRPPKKRKKKIVIPACMEF